MTLIRRWFGRDLDENPDGDATERAEERIAVARRLTDQQRELIRLAAIDKRIDQERGK